MKAQDGVSYTNDVVSLDDLVQNIHSQHLLQIWYMKITKNINFKKSRRKFLKVKTQLLVAYSIYKWRIIIRHN